MAHKKFCDLLTCYLLKKSTKCTISWENHKHLSLWEKMHFSFLILVSVQLFRIEKIAYNIIESLK